MSRTETDGEDRRTECTARRGCTGVVRI